MEDGKINAHIRRDYGEQILHEDSILADPIQQFKQWLSAVVTKNQELDPTAMVLSTVDDKGLPDSRVVLLKGVVDSGFVFFTNYESAKAHQLSQNPHAALNFYWQSMVRQVRVRGQIKRISVVESENYFKSRPRPSQLSALASPQSQEIPSREFLEDLVSRLTLQYGQGEIPYSKNWGGYCLVPEELEFWQGRDNRLHDRIQYVKQQDVWKHRRLAP